jgi:hypothetical protein
MPLDIHSIMVSYQKRVYFKIIRFIKNAIYRDMGWMQSDMQELEVAVNPVLMLNHHVTIQWNVTNTLK